MSGKPNIPLPSDVIVKLKQLENQMRLVREPNALLGLEKRKKHLEKELEKAIEKAVKFNPEYIKIHPKYFEKLLREKDTYKLNAQRFVLRDFNKYLREQRKKK